MDQPNTGSSPPGLVWATRLVASLALRPGERVLCLGPASGALASQAASRVGPSGQVVEGGPAGGRRRVLLHADNEFDAVAIDLATPNHHQQHADLLREVARVTAPTGRIAFALAPATAWDETKAQQLTTDSGLRAIAAQPNTENDTGDQQIVVVTAFPPLAGASGDDSDATAEIPTPAPVAAPSQASRRKRGLIVAAATAALVVAIAAGIGWGLAGPDPGDDTTDSGDTLLADDTDLDIDQPGPSEPISTTDPPTDEPTAGGGPPAGNSSSGSSSGSESGSSSSGGNREGAAGNRSPVIEDPGLSSDGLTLTIAPTVTDPDGDPVTLSFEVDGEPVAADDGTNTAEVTRLHTEVGYHHTATVVIAAADSRGAATRDTFNHELAAVTTVRFHDLHFTVNRPADCFKDTEHLFLEGKIEFSGAISVADTFKASVNEQLATDLPFGLDQTARFVGEKAPPLTFGLLVSFAGWTQFSEPAHSRSENGQVVIARFDEECTSKFTYSVDYHIR